MVIHIYTKQGEGYFKRGKIYGKGEFYEEEFNTGFSTHYKGTFDKGIKNNVDFEKYEITNSGFTYYNGPIINNKLDGNVIVINWEEPGEEKQLNQNDIDNSNSNYLRIGNGINNNCCKIHIYNSFHSTILNATKKELLYGEGVIITELSSETINVNISIKQNIHRNMAYFREFKVIEL